MFWLSWLEKLGKGTIVRIESLGRSFWLIFSSLLSIPGKNTFPKSLRVFFRQIHFLGVLSLPIIVLSGLFVGLVLGLQGVNVLRQFGAEENTGQLVVLSLLREMAPAVAALLYAGRAGSATTAEIGLMKTTEQLASLEMMGVDPVARVIAPRLWASFLTLPILVAIFSMVGVFGASLLAIEVKHVDAGIYWANVREITTLSDLNIMFLKSAVFAFLVTWVSVFQGYESKPTAEGVGYATTKTVVYASVAIFTTNFILSTFWF